jgi:RNase H-fold protein (predicted Holliday junction resolvase)
VLLSPFKGNKKNGERRRRLDYATARAILESACEEVENDNLKLL